MNYWLMKSEPFKYSWEQFVKDKQTHWDGVRNYTARNNMRAMKEGDLVLFYHSNKGVEVVGIAKVVTEAYQDPTIDDDRWSVVDIVPVKPMKKFVTLKDVKAEPELAEMQLVRQSRLSVSAVTPEEFQLVLKMGNTSI